MGPLFFSDSEGETPDVPSPPRRSKRLRRDHESPKSPPLNPTSSSQRAADLDTDLSPPTKPPANTREQPAEDMAPIIPAHIKAYIKELENYRAMDIDKHGLPKEARVKQVQDLEKKCASLQDAVQQGNTDRSNLIQQFTSQITTLEAAVMAKDQELSSFKEYVQQYRSTLLNVLPPLVEADEEKDAKIARLEGVEAKNGELEAELGLYKERNVQLIDENHRLQRFKEAVTVAVDKANQRA
ncbi:hypothetical protein LTR84_011341 [Exophiala bonariae]|uniref:Uncharacterized protein n=1 Tax=Exophiala bonariae TaxID=1690606 RepID=A0AAV9MSC0_9EURO|nr:hypothetical protein LTR84_011341 [Exophiala bonariae]